MSDFLPSHFGSPFITTLPDAKFDSRGRMMGFVESDVQRLERIAFINASKSRSNSPALSSSSGASSPSMSLISEPYSDPIELMANRLAAEFMSSDEFSSGSDDDVIYSTPKTKKRRGVPKTLSPILIIRKESSSPSPSFSPGHRRKRSSLSSIPEED